MQAGKSFSPTIIEHYSLAVYKQQASTSLFPLETCGCCSLPHSYPVYYHHNISMMLLMHIHVSRWQTGQKNYDFYIWHTCWRWHTDIDALTPAHATCSHTHMHGHIHCTHPHAWPHTLYTEVRIPYMLQNNTAVQCRCPIEASTVHVYICTHRQTDLGIYPDIAIGETSYYYTVDILRVTVRVATC